MKFVFLLFVVTGLTTKAQKQIGIKFEQNLSWTEVKKKALAENKYIFLDGFTTWCVPCKQMAIDIFPLKNVGEFFNKNFINVAVQFDKTKEDSEEVKRWYADAQGMKTLYKVDAYPTYLFFNPQGELVHFMKGGSNDAIDFIAKSKEALDPSKQYILLKKQYLIGRRDSTFLLDLANAAIKADDDLFIPTFVNAYLSLQKKLSTVENIIFASKATTASTDIGFNTLLYEIAKVDSIIGREARLKILNRIIFDEEIFPSLKINGKIINGGGFINYEGEVNRKVDWGKVKKNLEIRYPKMADFLMADAELTYAGWIKDWVRFNNVMNIYTSPGTSIDLNYINNKLSYFLLLCEEKPVLNKGLKWASIILQDKTRPNFVKNYSRLLYAAGKHEEAIQVMKNYINTIGVKDDIAEKNIEKMKKGEYIYW